MSRIPFRKLYILPIILLLYSCQTYKNSRMFETDVEYINDSIQALLDQPDHTMKIAPNDYISVMVYTANGEKLIDPDNQLSKITSPDIRTTQGTGIAKYLIRTSGFASLPMVGDIYLKGFTARQADSVLTKAYGKYYVDCFVTTKLINKRIIVFGPNGGKVLTIENDNMSIIEAIALYTSTSSVSGNSYSKMNKIRVIRGDLKNPHVQIVNLRTIEGMRQASLALLPGDIIYMEPQRKVFSEAMNDFMPLLSVFTSLITLAVLLGALK
jgi:polysaccharide export outer membrane protein